jgi:hypothetical protein
MVLHLVYAGLGWVVGAFTPSVLRKVKALFVKEANVVKSKL